MVACETYGTVGVEGKARRGLEGALPRARTVVAFAVCLSGLAMLLTYQVTDEIWWRSRLCALNTIASAAASATDLAATMHFEAVVSMKISDRGGRSLRFYVFSVQGGAWRRGL